MQKQLAAKKRAKEDAEDLLKQKAGLEKEKKTMAEKVAETQVALKRKLATVGNLVDESVPVNNNEVCVSMRPSPRDHPLMSPF